MESKGDIYKLIFDNAGTGILLSDNKGVILAANKAFCERTGFFEDEIAGKHKFCSFIHPDDKKRVEEIYKNQTEKQTGRGILFEYARMKKQTKP